MKYSEIEEARRGAQRPEQQKETLESYLNSLPSLDNIYIHYTNVDKIGVNPRTDWYETPPGIYTYRVTNWYSGPGNYVEVKWKPGFARNTRWVFVLKTNPTTRLLNFGNYSWQQFVQDAQLLGVKTAELFPSASDQELKTIKPNQLAQRIYQTAARSPNPLAAFRKKLGYDGVEDPNYGYIHKNERSQTVFFTRSAFTVLKQLRDYPNTHKHKQKKTLNAQQALEWIRQGQWQAINYLDGQQINLPADLQMQLLQKQNQFGSTQNSSSWTQAVQAVANPTEEFFKALIDNDKYWLVDLKKATPAVKSYLLTKKPTAIVGMVDPPADAPQILAQHYNADTVQKLMTLSR
jgi:hypothetical protein